MKKIVLAAMILMLLLIGCEKKAISAMVDPSLGWNPVFSFPMSTGVEGFFLPRTGQFALGTSITAVEMKIPAITFLSFEGNALIAKTFGADKNNPDAEDPLYGLGVKVSTNLFEVSVSDNVKMFPSFGTGLLNNFKEVQKWNDFIDGFRWTIYGTLVQWRFK